MTRLKDMEEERRKRRRDRFESLLRYAPVLLILPACYRFIGLGFGEIQAWDESLYALRTLAALKFGAIWDQAAYMPGGLYFAAHPPLYVWASTAACVLFGQEEWVFRLPSAIAGAVSVFLMYGLSRVFLNKVYSLVAAGFLAFSPLITFYSRQGQLDLLLMTCMLAFSFVTVLYIRNGHSRQIVLAGFFLGLALMTKILLAFSLPAALMAAAVFLRGTARTRCFRMAILSFLISIPLWFPWILSITLRHGNGDYFFLISDVMPFGKTLLGEEGTVKEIGKLYYLNQLIVHLSFLFPPTIVGIVRALRPLSSDPSTRFLSLFIVIHLIVIWVMGSMFVVYLIPIFPAAVLLAVLTLRSAGEWDPSEQTWMAIASLLCLVWSLSGGIRSEVKSALSSLGAFTIPSFETILIVLTPVFLVLLGLVIIRKAHRAYRISTWFAPAPAGILVLLMALATLFQIWFIHPDTYTDGAAEIVRRLNERSARTVALVGIGGNPQLTFYLEGEDIQWPSEKARAFLRYEPASMGAQSIVTTLDRISEKDTIAVIIKKSEIAAGVFRSADDVLPERKMILMEQPRYTLALLVPLGKSLSTNNE